MMYEDENSRELWDEFERIKKKRKLEYGFQNVFIEMPESDINSPEEVIAMFESLGDSHKQEVARQLNLTIDELKELIKQGWKEFKEDNKYRVDNDYERYFFQVVDPMVEEIKMAPRNLDLEIKDNLIFGLLPTREINAEAIQADDNLGYIIGINYGMMFFLDEIGQLFDRIYARLRDHLKNPTVHIENDSVDKYIEGSISCLYCFPKVC